MLVAGVLLFSLQASAAPRIALIIDDLGYRYNEGLRATRLPGPVACAVLPATPRGETLARAAHADGKEVFLHLPLQANEEDGPNEPGDLVLDMSRGQFADTFSKHLASIPFVSGINTHRGSLLTRHPGHMAWLMDEINSHKGLMFVDSFTTPASVAMQLARESGVPAVRRDVFLDYRLTEEDVLREFERLKMLARRHGTALGIGHPFDETLSVLERELPKLAGQGYELVPVSSLLKRQSVPPAPVAVDAGQ